MYGRRTWWKEGHRVSREDSQLSGVCWDAIAGYVWLHVRQCLPATSIQHDCAQLLGLVHGCLQFREQRCMEVQSAPLQGKVNLKVECFPPLTYWLPYCMQQFMIWLCSRDACSKNAESHREITSCTCSTSLKQTTQQGDILAGWTQGNYCCGQNRVLGTLSAGLYHDKVSDSISSWLCINVSYSDLPCWNSTLQRKAALRDEAIYCIDKH